MKMDDFIKEIKSTEALSDIKWHQRLRPVKPTCGKLKGGLNKELTGALKALGVRELFSHQAEAINIVDDGSNVVVMTPTASGKSLIYNLTVLRAILKEPDTRALYLFPLKGLARDQLKTLDRFAENLGIENLAKIYDGDTTAHQKKKIR
ncbi:MAG: DEAD/DEAH box helicase, partial [Thermodesulfobacteriota bacterium]